VGAAFYSYTLPESAGFPDQPILPEMASYDSQLGEFPPSYDDVRATADPGRAILDFVQCTYEAVARLRGWSMDELALQDEHPPRPRERPQETSEIATRKAVDRLAMLIPMCRAVLEFRRRRWPGSRA
jgi:hypothetical protein